MIKPVIRRFESVNVANLIYDCSYKKDNKLSVPISYDNKPLFVQLDEIQFVETKNNEMVFQIISRDDAITYQLITFLSAISDKIEEDLKNIAAQLKKKFPTYNWSKSFSFNPILQIDGTVPNPCIKFPIQHDNIPVFIFDQRNRVDTIMNDSRTKIIVEFKSVDFSNTDIVINVILHQIKILPPLSVNWRLEEYSFIDSEQDIQELEEPPKNIFKSLLNQVLTASDNSPTQKQQTTKKPVIHEVRATHVVHDIEDLDDLDELQNSDSSCAEPIEQYFIS